ncbi:MAG: hypothetical protein HY557_03580 [Euryarchaeota archaeon]|nr:hypothetical protein [Euryarchaeota archaeon]
MYPQPYPYPTPPAPLRTPKGLGWCWKAYLIYIVALGLSAVIALLLYAALARLSPGAGFSEVLSALLPAAIGGLAVGVLVLVVIVFYLVGFYDLYKGRGEFGPEHARNVRLSFFLLLAAIVVFVASFVVVLIVALASGLFVLGSPPSLDAYYALTIVAIGFGIVQAAIIAALLVLPLRVLAKPSHERYLYVAAAVQTATPGIAGALSLLQLPRLIPLFQDATGFASLDSTIGIPTVVSSALGMFVFAIYLVAYRGADSRVTSGELKPTLPPAQAASWMPGPMVPPAQPPVQPPPPGGHAP